jgi:hypothetical protein
MIPMVSEAAIAICWVMFLTPLIVMNNHRAKRLRKNVWWALGVPAVVKLTKRGTSGKVKPLEPDPEADARVEAWFARNIRQLGS